MLATRNFSSRSIITKKGDGSQVKESTDSSTTIEDDDVKEDKKGGVDRSSTVIAKEPEGPASQGTPPNSPAAAVSAFSRVVGAARETNKQNQVQGNPLGLAAVLLQGAQETREIADSLCGCYRKFAYVAQDTRKGY